MILGWALLILKINSIENISSLAKNEFKYLLVLQQVIGQRIESNGRKLIDF